MEVVTGFSPATPAPAARRARQAAGLPAARWRSPAPATRGTGPDPTAPCRHTLAPAIGPPTAPTGSAATPAGRPARRPYQHPRDLAYQSTAPTPPLRDPHT